MYTQLFLPSDYMELPEIWLFFGAQIHQDFLIDYPDFLSGISDLLDDLTASQRVELYEFLRDIKSNGYSNQQLAKVWGGSGAEIYIVGERFDLFFDEIYKVVEKSVKLSKSE